MKKFYSIAGRVLSIDTFDDWSTAAVSKLVDGWFVRPLETDHAPDATLKISCGSSPPEIPSDLSKFEISDAGTCHTDQTTFYLEFEGSLVRIAPSEVTVWIDRPQDLDATTLSRVLSQAFAASLRRCGLFELHSGAVVPPGESGALLIAGPSGSGKSTLTAKLAASGWTYLSDDMLLLRNNPDGIEAIPLRQFFALTPRTVETLPLMPRMPVDRRKERFTPQDFFSGKQIESAKPSVILFSEITYQPVTRWEELTSAQTMMRLLRLCPWACYDPVSNRDHLTLLTRLARETSGFDILAGTDLLQDPHLAADLVHQAYSRN